jgi:hypothetical protein
MTRFVERHGDSEGKEVPSVDKHGNPEYYQLQTILDLETQTGTITEEQKSVFLQDPRFKDPMTGKPKIFPHKILFTVVRILIEADEREWLKTRWNWEALNRAKQIETSMFDVGVYDHPVPDTRLVLTDPNKRDSPSKSVVTAINYQQVYEIPFSKENFEKELAKRSAPKDDENIVMVLQKINNSGIKYPHVYQVEDREQFLNRPFTELWDYLASAPLKDTSKTKMGAEDFKNKNKQYS